MKKKIKVLNLYAGIGGNRKYWKNVEVTAIENNTNVAAIYKYFYPEDNIIVTDAHKYLLENYDKYDFIWSSPPCPTHSKMGKLNKKRVVQYPDMRLYQEILLLQHYFKGKYVVENVIPFYEALIKPQELHRHSFWANFKIEHKEFPRLKVCTINDRERLQKAYGFNLDQFKGIDKRLCLRNCVEPKLGKHIFECIFKTIKEEKQEVLI